MSNSKDRSKKNHIGCKEIKVITEKMIQMKKRKWEANIWIIDVPKEERKKWEQEKKIQKFNRRKFPEIKKRIFSWNQGRLQSIDTKGLQCKRETKINKESSRSRNILMTTKFLLQRRKKNQVSLRALKTIDSKDKDTWKGSREFFT